MNAVELQWRLQRLSKMSPSEVGWRLSDHARQRAWTRKQVPPGTPSPRSWVRPPRWRRGEQPIFRATLPPGALSEVPDEARRATLAAAEQLLAGHWEILGRVRDDLADPDWFLDPVTGRRAPQAEYCFRIDHRRETVTGNVKQVWELSRMHHVTVLAAAFALSGDERFAVLAAGHLRSWWTQNPFLSGVHWTSGIEVGLRLIAWAWIRRLLDPWAGIAELFERNDMALAHLWWHQRYLATFRSRGSSANNHLIAEAAGRLVGALAFDWFDESARWAAHAADQLEGALADNTFPSGVNREMATDYHGFVAELGLVGAAEATHAGRPLAQETWDLLCRMLDVTAATVDVAFRAPRQGDGDDGRALVFGSPADQRWGDLLAMGRALFGAPAWWPGSPPTVASVALSAMAGRHDIDGRPARRPSHYADAGMTLLRTSPADGPEIWCRCDAGPHGFLSIAAHAHADALSVEVRHDGTDILADPGTYCYHGEERWRTYFRSTLGHNTLELDGQDQSTSGGPFLWRRHAQSSLIGIEQDAGGETIAWSAEHYGYGTLGPGARHRRTVCLAGPERRVVITDRVETTGEHPYRLAFHFGPSVDASLGTGAVVLSWDDYRSSGRATLRLSEGPAWSLARGSSDPTLGWYSPGFGRLVPSWTLIGTGKCRDGDTFETVLAFDP